MKLTIRALILTLCVAGATAGAMIPKGMQVVNSHCPVPHPMGNGTSLALQK
jgi:hypothetical protein